MVTTQDPPAPPALAAEPPAAGPSLAAQPPAHYDAGLSEQIPDGLLDLAAAAVPTPERAGGPAEAPPEAVDTGTPTPDPYGFLDQADPVRLRQHPRIAGLVGDMLARERPRLRQQLQADLERERQQQAERDAAERQDIVALGEAKLREVQAQIEQERAASEATRHRAAALSPESDAYRVLQQFAAAQPAEVQQRFLDPATGQGKTYPGDPAAGYRAYLDEVVAASVEHRLSQERARLRAEAEQELRPRLEREVRASLRAELLGERNERAAAPDLTSGRPDAGATLTMERYLSMTPREQRAARKSGLVDAMAKAMLEAS